MASTIADRIEQVPAGTSSQSLSMLGLHPRAVIYWVVAIVLMAGIILGHNVDSVMNWRGAATLHTVMEAMATLLAVLVGVMALVRYYSKKESIFLFVGAGFLGTASLDGFHAIVTSAYFKPMMPSDLPYLIPWSWVASRLFLSILMFLSWLAWKREEKLGEAGRIPENKVYIGTALFTALSFWFFIFYDLPPAYYPEIFFHRPEEFVPAFFFFLALLGYLQKGDWRVGHFEHWLVLSLIIGFISQAVFMSHSGVLFDYEFDVAHTLKKVTYICVLIGLLISMYSVFKKEEEGVIALGEAYRQMRESFQRAESEIKNRHRVERRLRTHEQELLRSNAELEKFAYIASHDMQEPLRKVQSFGERLESKYADALDDRGRDYLKRMRLAASRMSVLINDLLKFSRVNSDSKAYEVVDLNEVLTGVLGDLEISIDETNSTIDCEPLPSIEADPLQMRQLLQNLIGNAIKYRDPQRNPAIVIRHAIVQLDDDPDDYCEITVADNGIGFEQEYSERIFEIFQRLHGRNDYEGTGVGLAVVRKIAERHGGSVNASGIPGKGSTFTVLLKTKHPVAEDSYDD